jgi:hypothetical protein
MRTFLQIAIVAACAATCAAIVIWSLVGMLAVRVLS